jgi:hypothetical protein
VIPQISVDSAKIREAVTVNSLFCPSLERSALLLPFSQLVPSNKSGVVRLADSYLPFALLFPDDFMLNRIYLVHAHRHLAIPFSSCDVLHGILVHDCYDGKSDRGWYLLFR